MVALKCFDTRKLCDQDKDDRITIYEFCALMWLAEKVQEGNPIPDTLPHELLASSGDISNPNVSLCEDKEKNDIVDDSSELKQMRIELNKRDEEIREVNTVCTQYTCTCMHVYVCMCTMFVHFIL